MAESIIIHFLTEGAPQIEERIGSRFYRLGDDAWQFPSKDCWLGNVTPYLDFDSEYEPSEKEIVRAKLGGDPTHSFDFEIRRSRSDEACDVLEQFVRESLGGLRFVVDDMARIMTKEEISIASDFLDIYRYKKQAAEQGADDQAAAAVKQKF
ncbi:MAG: hypothetical protein ACSHYF_16840 [Verrucomicrobiaceae bacterium]